MKKISVLVNLCLCSLLLLTACDQRHKELRQEYQTTVTKLTGNYTADIPSLEKLAEQIDNYCQEDSARCRQNGIDTLNADLQTRLSVLYQEKNAVLAIQQRLEQVKQVVGLANELTDLSNVADLIDAFLEAHPSSTHKAEFTAQREEVLFRKFTRLYEDEYSSELDIDDLSSLIDDLSEYQYKFTKEEYRTNAITAVQNLKTELDRKKQVLIEEGIREAENEQREAALSAEQAIERYRTRYNQAINELLAAMDGQAISTAKRGHTFYCGGAIESQSSPSQNTIGQRTEVSKSYTVKIGGTVCDVSRESVTVQGYVEGDGSSAVSYRVTNSSKN